MGCSSSTANVRPMEHLVAEDVSLVHSLPTPRRLMLEQAAMSAKYRRPRIRGQSTHQSTYHSIVSQI
jgi:hypothetical protein